MLWGFLLTEEASFTSELLSILFAEIPSLRNKNTPYSPAVEAFKDDLLTSTNCYVTKAAEYIPQE